MVRAFTEKFFKWAIPCLCFFIFVFSKQLVLHVNFADGWIWTTDRWWRKQPLYQLRHSHCPKFSPIFSAWIFRFLFILVTLKQCDQILRLFFNLWAFTSMKICPKVPKICQSRFKILPNPWKFAQDFAKVAKFRQNRVTLLSSLWRNRQKIGL